MFVLFKKVSLFSTFESLLPLSVIILVTTKKKANLILNVDGCIAACFVDMLRSCGAFTMEEAAELVQNGCLNGMFVLGRSIGFIGHHLDQKRLKQGLYRHPWDDISYLNDSA
jgi:ATP citrate (pro-S)-lyase